MQTPDLEPAPFAPGDRVIFRPRPEGVETVELVEHSSKGWSDYWIRTSRQVAPSTIAHRYAPALEFDPATPAEAEIVDVPAAGPKGCRARLRRLGRGAGAVVLALLALAVLWGALLVELPS